MDQKQVIISNNSGSKKYRRLNLLGTGGFAKCFEVIKLDTNTRFACKIIPKKIISEIKQRYKLMLEIKIHKHLKHQYIVGFDDVFEDAENIYIIIEYCQHQTLKDLVKRRKRLTELEIRYYVSQIVEALMFIHSKDIIHRDLKLGNILIGDKMKIKLCDFGLSTRLKEPNERKKTVCGTPNYIAPEILDASGHGFQVDIWSLGVIIYTMLTGKPPFEDDSVESTYFNIRNNQYQLPKFRISQEIEDLIKRIFVVNPSQRITLEDIYEHPFFQPYEDIQKQLPVYTLAVPPINDQRNLIMTITPIEMESLDKDTILNKSIIIKDSSHNCDSEYLQDLQFSLRKRSNIILNEGEVLYISYCVMSGNSLGFLLSNGQMGSYFVEDASSLILEYDDRYFNYFERRENDKEEVSQYNTGVLDGKVQEKYQRMSYFTELMRMIYSNQELEKMRKYYGKRNQRESHKDKETLLHVKKAVMVGQNVLIRLSNQAIQLSFPDQTVAYIKSIKDNEILYFKKYNKTYRYTPDTSSILNIEVKRKLNLFLKVLKGISAKDKTRLTP